MTKLAERSADMYRVEYDIAAPDVMRALSGELFAYMQSYDYSTIRPHFVQEDQFNILAEWLNEDVFYQTNPRRILGHPAYQQIRTMGAENIIPAILRRLEYEPNLWLVVLNDLTGELPVQQAHRGRTYDMVADWKQWGREKGYIV